MNGFCCQHSHLLFLYGAQFEEACLSKGDMLLQKSTKLPKSRKQQPSRQGGLAKLMPDILLMKTTQLVDAPNSACFDQLEQIEVVDAESSWPPSHAGEISQRQAGLIHQAGPGKRSVKLEQRQLTWVP